MKRIILTCALSLALPAMAPAATDLALEGDWIAIPATGTVVIPISRLLENDIVPTGSTLTFRLVDGPPGLSAQPSEDPVELVYEPDYERYGDYYFTYELVPGDSAPQSTVSVISLIPGIQPLAGNWASLLTGFQTDTGGTSCEIGDGAEVGWYDSRAGIFSLCDFVGLEDLVGCVKVAVPREPGVRNTEDFRLASIADWDGDGDDEPALYDPATGVLQKYEYSDCAKGPCLVEAGQWFNTTYRSSMPLAGHWRQGFGIELATFDRVTGRLEAPGASPIHFTNPNGPGQPVAGDWAQIGLDNLGLWQDSTHQLFYLADLTGQAWGDLQAGSAQGLAFAGRWSQCDASTSYLGVYNGATSEVNLIDLVPASGRPGLQVKVVVDPGTGGGGGGDGIE